MQAALSAMAAQIIILSPPQFSPNIHHPTPLLGSSFLHGAALKLPTQSMTLSVSAKPLTVVASTKRAVAVLKGNSKVEGVVTLAQKDDGLSSLLFPLLFFFGQIYLIQLFILVFVKYMQIK